MAGWGRGPPWGCRARRPTSQIRYSACVRTGSVPDDFVCGVEVIECDEQECCGEDIDEGPLNPDFSGAVEPHVGADTTSYIIDSLLLAVMSAYLRMGNTFMKLRLNIPNIYNHTSLEQLRTFQPSRPIFAPKFPAEPEDLHYGTRRLYLRFG